VVGTAELTRVIVKRESAAAESAQPKAMPYARSRRAGGNARLAAADHTAASLFPLKFR
jgi:hypothetical protein